MQQGERGWTWGTLRRGLAAQKPRMDWTISGRSSPASTVKRSPITGDLAIWMAEPSVPRVVRAMAGNNVILFEPGDETGAHSQRISRDAIAPVDQQLLHVA
jgi:hypothetical protein